LPACAHRQSEPSGAFWKVLYEKRARKDEDGDEEDKEEDEEEDEIETTTRRKETTAVSHCWAMPTPLANRQSRKEHMAWCRSSRRCKGREDHRRQLVAGSAAASARL